MTHQEYRHLGKDYRIKIMSHMCKDFKDVYRGRLDRLTLERGLCLHVIRPQTSYSRCDLAAQRSSLVQLSSAHTTGLLFSNAVLKSSLQEQRFDTSIFISI
ncbi:hypothetical protein O3G_MSEX014732 [Manduca sexta]|uniref:Uncharacterized protein n=1 Tax=Manduca sexta TaxID=7130 RepID=A0A921ZXU6_MANSE|nr:hypothetical protein O3G_MSEX014732 [Manduca sexta]